MTTIAYTPGLFAADTCLTHEVEDDARARSQIRKLKFFRLKDGGVIATASKGDAAIGDALDELLLAQTKAILNGRKFSGILMDELNKPARLRARKKVIKKGDVESILVWFLPSEGDYAYVLDESGRVTKKDPEIDYLAIGSDNGPALGAMHHGGNAFDAVLASCKHGVYTAQPIHYLHRRETDGQIVFEKF